jgi:hypothetical protein
MPDQPIKHGHQHRFKGPDPIGIGQYEIKLFPDQALANLLGMSAPVTVGNNLFEFMIPEDLGGCRLRYADAYVSTVASAAIQLQVRNATSATNLLDTVITIDAGEYTSKTAATPPVAHQGGTAECAWGDMITVDVTAAGTGGWGLGVVLEFSV